MDELLQLKGPMIDLLLGLADDKLVAGVRNSDWTGLGPILEEDIAFSSLAQDEIAHAQAVYELLAGPTGRSADDLAFGRTPAEMRCCAIVEIPDDFDWATALARHFFCDHFDAHRLERLARSSWAPLAALARRLVVEERVHVEHVDGWMSRLGRSTPAARQRVQAALDALAPHASMLLEPVEEEPALVAAGLYPLEPAATDTFTAWRDDLRAVLEPAGLRALVTRPGPDARGGRRGVHTRHLAPLLEEMSEVYRIEPGAAW
jgi:ring-1,2-phenylacetyl-CoA epoxidase subunit PaaC